MGVKLWGIGIIQGSDIADAAYSASRAATHKDCITMDAQHIWDDGWGEHEDVLAEWVQGARIGMIAKSQIVPKILGFLILAKWLTSFGKLAGRREN